MIEMKGTVSVSKILINKKQKMWKMFEKFDKQNKNEERNQKIVVWKKYI